MVISLGRTVAALSIVGLLLLFGPSRAIAADGPVTAPSTSSIEQALTQLTSEDESIRDAAIRVLISQGDAGLVPRLEGIRASASRSIRQAIKPLMDLLKNRAKLASPDSDARRSAATDLGSSGNPSAIPWLDAAKVNESNKWVRYTMEESSALIKLASDDPSIKVAAARSSVNSAVEMRCRP